MSLVIYRIDEGLIGRLVNWIKKPPLPVITPGAGIAAYLPRNFHDLMRDNCYVLSNEDEIKRFEDPRGYELTPNVYYIRHPLSARTNWLVPAPDFHGFIVREQVAEIVSYIRANTRAKVIDFQIRSGSNFDLIAGGKHPEIPIKLEGKAEFKKHSEYHIRIEADAPLKPSEKRKQFYWIESLPDVVAAVDKFSGGKFSITVESDVSFGMAAKVAEYLSINSNFLTKQAWKLDVECA